MPGTPFICYQLGAARVQPRHIHAMLTCEAYCSLNLPITIGSHHLGVDLASGPFTHPFRDRDLLHRRPVLGQAQVDSTSPKRILLIPYPNPG